MVQQKKFSRAQGASSGAECWYIALGLIFLATYPFYGVTGFLAVLASLFLFQFAIMDPWNRTIIFLGALGQQYGVAASRNGGIGFAECVRPGGKPSREHALHAYKLPGWLTSMIFFPGAVLILAVNPIVVFIRPFYPEHREGVNSGRYSSLIWLMLRHPMVVQGEGPSNGDGLAFMCGAETALYPMSPLQLEQGPLDHPYWLLEGGPPRFRDLFHDKLFCHRFFDSFGAPHPKLVASVVNHRTTEQFLAPNQAPQKLVWKPRYSTMSLGVEHFEGWQNKDREGWAPSDHPYVVEEFLVSSEYPQAAEWYRMPTLWAHDESEPKVSYFWRTRNEPSDGRVQTDIVGGAYCVPSLPVRTFVGPSTPGTCHDPRTKQTVPLDPVVDAALQRAAQLAVKMHACLGKELYSIGWDLLVVDGVPMFIEFNVNNGFFVADHTVEEVYHMIDFYKREGAARLQQQVYDFDPAEADRQLRQRIEAAKGK